VSRPGDLALIFAAMTQARAGAVLVRRDETDDSEILCRTIRDATREGTQGSARPRPAFSPLCLITRFYRAMSASYLRRRSRTKTRCAAGVTFVHPPRRPSGVMAPS
jgi:hypothetical protein